MRSIILSLIAFLSAIAPLPAQSRTSTEQMAPKIGIVYTAPHPVINDIITGFKDIVSKHFHKARFIERHADGRPEQYGAVVLATIGDEPNLLAPITTPITQLTIEQSRGRIPVAAQ